MLVSAFFTLLALYYAHAQFLVSGGQSNFSDTQYLHLILQLQGQLNSMQISMNDMKDRIAELEETDGTSCVSSCQTPPTVGFMAQLSASIVNPAKGRTVVFDQVETNKGNAYNPAHGIFTAPYNGTYNFNLVVSAPPATGSHVLHLFIKKNNTEVGFVYLDNNDRNFLRGTTDVTIHMLKGDEVWVDLDYVRGSNTIQGCCFHTHLSGFLIGVD